MGCIFIPLAWDFFSIKKKMSDYYGEYLFSSPYVAFLISKCQKLSEESMFSSPPGAYLISIMIVPDDKKTLYPFSSPPGAYLISIIDRCFDLENIIGFSSPPGAYLISIPAI